MERDKGMGMLCVMALALALAAQVALGQFLETTILLPDTLLGLTGPTHLTWDSASNAVYATGGPGTAVIVIDAPAGRKAARIPLWDEPSVVNATCLVPERSELYCFAEDGFCRIIDCRRNLVVDSLPMPRTSYHDAAACYNPSTGKLYFAMDDDGIAVIDCAQRRVVDTIPVSGAARVACSPRSNRIYCSTAYSTADSLFVIDGAADTVDTVIRAGSWIRFVYYSAGKDRIYCYGLTPGSLSVFDCATNQVLATVPLPGGEWFLACADTAGKAVYVLIDDSVFVVDGGSHQVRSRLHPPRWVYALCYHPGSGRFCLAGGTLSTGMGETMLYDGEADTVVGRVPSGYTPFAVVGAGASIYVGSSFAVSRVDPFACRLLDTLLTDTRLGRACWDQTSGLLGCTQGQSYSPFVGLVDPGLCELRRWAWHFFCVEYLAVPGNGWLYGLVSGDQWLNLLGYDVRADSLMTVMHVGIAPAWFGAAGLGTNEAATRAYCVGKDGIDGTCYLATADLVNQQHLMQARLGIADTAYGPLWNPAADKVYLAGIVGGPRFLITDGTTGLPIRTLDLPAVGPLCVDRLRNRVFCVGSTLSVVDGASDSVLAQWYLADTAVAAAACDPSLGQVYAVARNSLIICSSPTGQPEDTVLLPTTGVTELLCDTIAGKVYCLDPANRIVHVVDGQEGRVLTSIPVGEEPMNMAWVPPYRRVFVLSSADSRLSVILDTTTAVAERSMSHPVRRTQDATVVRGALVLGADAGRQNSRNQAMLLNTAGQKVMELVPGRNDVRQLVPGVYYLRKANAHEQTKLVILR